jgi:hypothetical protein
MDLFKMPSKQGNVCTVFLMIVGDVSGGTGKPLEVHIKEHRYNLKQGLLQKSKSAQQAYKEGNQICWKEATVLQTEPNNTYRSKRNWPTYLW